MKLRQIRKYLKNALLIALAMIVIAGVTGLSYQAHYCHNKLSGIAFYTELGFQQAASCGCKDDADPVNTQTSGNFPVLTKNGCCSNISFFSKLIIESHVTDFAAHLTEAPATLAININISAFDISHSVKLPVSDTGIPPEPLAGRKLVLFLSQQRIPLISYNC